LGSNLRFGFGGLGMEGYFRGKFYKTKKEKLKLLLNIFSILIFSIGLFNNKTGHVAIFILLFKSNHRFDLEG